MRFHGVKFLLMFNGKGSQIPVQSEILRNVIIISLDIWVDNIGLLPSYVVTDLEDLVFINWMLKLQETKKCVK